MNRVKKEMMFKIARSKAKDLPDDELEHIGTENSGRYPRGSGDDPNQHSGDFLSRVEKLKVGGKTQKEIADELGITTDQFRIQNSLAVNARKDRTRERIRSLREDGLSDTKIAKQLGYSNESSIRSLMNQQSEARSKRAQNKADYLKQFVDEKGMVDVGSGTEHYLDCSKELLKKSLYILKLQGYEVRGGGIPTGTNRQTNQKVLCPPGTPESEIYKYDKINTLSDFVFREGSEDPSILKYPKSMDSNRIKIKYAEEGGLDKDGLIELRRGVEDLSLGKSHYAQVRVLIDDNMFAKGMAIYSDDIPDGVDMVFNTNKKVGTPKEKVFKPITEDPDNPFGSLIKVAGQNEYTDKNGNKQLGLINKRAEEGDWEDWKRKLPSQFLSKQPESLIKRQLGLAITDKEVEYDEICSLTNPTIKKALLASFANDCDSASVHLEAAALPRQKYRVLMPIPELKDNEVYAPTFNDGEQVALVRFPHGGTFEIPVLTVNNKHPKAKQVLENAQDAIGINSVVAERLSGADFDGDTVLTVPTGRGSKVQIRSTPKLKGLEGFNPKDEYPAVPGMTYMKREVPGLKPGSKKTIDNTQTEMGIISNLIADMTLKGATDDDLAKAVRHSMVVIDAAKHKLNYKKSETDNEIRRLKKTYQGHVDDNGKYRQGAATLISRAKSETTIPKRVGSPNINQKGKKWYDPSKPEGALIYKTITEPYIDKNGKERSGTYKLYKKIKNPSYRKGIDPVSEEFLKDPNTGKVLKEETGKTKTKMQKSTQMADTDDAFALSSGHPTETRYAEFANKMKAMSNAARKEMVYTGKIKYSASAKLTYQKEVDRLMAAVNVAEKNKPRERDAQRIANTAITAKKQDNPDMSQEEIKKHTQLELNKARIKVGAKREKIEISDREWEAIQAGAVSEEKLKSIIDNTDLDKLRARATPRSTIPVTDYKINRIKILSNNGSTIAQIAQATGLSTATVSKYIN